MYFLNYIMKLNSFFEGGFYEKLCGFFVAFIKGGLLWVDVVAF